MKPATLTVLLTASLAACGCGGPGSTRALAPALDPPIHGPRPHHGAPIALHADPDPTLQNALVLFGAGRYARSADHFLRAARLPAGEITEEDARRALLAASIAYLLADQREDFHRVLRDLRAALPEHDSLWPGEPLRIMLFLDAFMRGEPAKVPPELRSIVVSRKEIPQ